MKRVLILLMFLIGCAEPDCHYVFIDPVPPGVEDPMEICSDARSM